MPSFTMTVPADVLAELNEFETNDELKAGVKNFLVGKVKQARKQSKQVAERAAVADAAIADAEVVDESEITVV